MICKICGKDLVNNHGWCKACGHPVSWSIDSSKYKPNKHSVRVLLSTAAVSVVMVSHLVSCLVQGKVTLLYGRHGDAIYEFTGVGMLLAITCLFSSAIGYGSFVIDHFDNRNNEFVYRKLQGFCSVLMFLTYILAFQFGVKIST